MNTTKIGIILLLVLGYGSLAGCGEDVKTSSSAGSSGSTTNSGSLGASTPTGIITADGFYLLQDPIPLEVFNSDIQYSQKEAVITAFADDFNDLVITSGQTINFKTEWGTFVDSDSCVVENGQCSVTWRSGAPATAPSDCEVAITAWTYGEETFFDANDNNKFDQTEAFIDVEEPFLDINGNGVFDAGIATYELIGEFIDIINFTGTTPGATNGMHDGADGKYTGSLCASGNTLCTTNTSMIIHARYPLYIQSKFDEPAGEDIDGDTVTGETGIRYCGG
jgi:hypothetical protein